MSDMQNEKVQSSEGSVSPEVKVVDRLEWTDPFNSFNSWKGLMYRKHYEGILSGHFLPPIEASIDPTYSCNVDCVWCNSRRILYNDNKKGHSMSRDHLLRLVGFLLDWGVEGFCYAGGGEPTLHPSLWEAMRLVKARGKQNAVITNGLAISTEEKRETAVRCCRWVGVSLDACTPERYGKVKGIDPRAFETVINNIRAMVELNRKYNAGCDIAVKYLIHPANADQIAETCKLARELGVAHFHARPAASENIEGLGEVLDFPMDVINDQLAQCLAMQTENFKTFGVRHKFAGNFNLKHGFSRCLSAPLAIQCGADGNVYMCVDWRGSAEYILCAHYPDPERILDAWGSPEHLAMMRAINVDNCPRCTYGVYARQIEGAVESDGMCVNFP